MLVTIVEVTLFVMVLAGTSTVLVTGRPGRVTVLVTVLPPPTNVDVLVTVTASLQGPGAGGRYEPKSSAWSNKFLPCLPAGAWPGMSWFRRAPSQGPVTKAARTSSTADFILENKQKNILNNSI